MEQRGRELDSWDELVERQSTPRPSRPSSPHPSFARWINVVRKVIAPLIPSWPSLPLRPHRFEILGWKNHCRSLKTWTRSCHNPHNPRAPRMLRPPTRRLGRRRRKSGVTNRKIPPRRDRYLWRKKSQACAWRAPERSEPDRLLQL